MKRLEHLLVILGEECAEVQQRVSKALRFGLDEVQPGQSLTNAQRLYREICDLQCALEMLGMNPMHAYHQHPEGMNECPICDKEAAVERFLKYSDSLGLLEKD